MDTVTGTLTPAAPLHVIGDTNITCQISSRKSGCSQISYIHTGTTADWLIRAGSTSGNVIIQDAGGNIQLGSNASTSTVPGSINLGIPPALIYASVPSLSSSQIGYNVSSGIITGGTLTTSVANICSITVNAGVYLILATLNVAGWISGTGNGTLLSVYVGSSQPGYSASVYCPNNSIAYSTVQQQLVATCTASQNISLRAAVNNNSSTIANATIQAVRIA